MAVSLGMKILVVLGIFDHGGAQRVVSHLSMSWAKSHQVTIVLFENHQPIYPFGGEIHYLKTPTSRNPLVKIWRNVQRVTRLVGLIRRGGFTHLIGLMEFANLPLIVAGLVTGNLNRTIVSVHRSVTHIAWYHRALMRVLYQLPRRVVAVSFVIEQQLIAMGLPKAKITFITNPAPDVPTGPLLRPTRGEKYILAVGRLGKRKGFDLLLRAYVALPNPKPDLVILGEGEERQALTDLAQRLGISQQVHLIGTVPHPENWYAHAELFVLSSRFEGWGMVIVEAMTCGCPVVSFACPTGPDEIIAHGKNGLLVENGNVEGLTKGMAQLLGDAKLSQRLAVAGRKRARDFDVEKIAPLWLKP